MPVITLHMAWLSPGSRDRRKFGCCVADGDFTRAFMFERPIILRESENPEGVVVDIYRGSLLFLR